MTRKEALWRLEFKVGKRTLARAAYNYARLMQGGLPPEERTIEAALADIMRSAKESRE